jgi:two-component system nitrate/nitrite response regulator NarL
MMPAIQILLVDDHQLICHNLCNLLATGSEFNVISRASIGFEAVRKAQECQPDVILLDVSIPDLNDFMRPPS